MRFRQELKLSLKTKNEIVLMFQEALLLPTSWSYETIGTKLTVKLPSFTPAEKKQILGEILHWIHRRS